MRRILILMAAVFLWAGPANAVEPDEILSDPALESRARAVGANLRCLVCQNQSIDESDATLARDLRVLVRERIVAGDTNEQVIDYVVSRYGDFVLLNPPFKPLTYALWFAPGLIGGGGIIWLVLFLRRRGAVSEPKTAVLSAEEKKRLDELMAEEAE